MIPLPDAPQNHPVFLEAYAAAHRELIGEKPAPRKAATGTIAAVVQAYLKSEDFVSAAANTKAVRRRALDDIAERYGTARLADLRPRHIRQDLAPLGAHPANNRLKVWRALCKWCHAQGLVEINPAREVAARKTPKSDGFTAWTRDEFAAFRAHWPIGTAPRLAFEVMYLTCAAVGDACRLGDGNLRDGWITYRRQKSGSEAACPFTAPAPAWSEPDGMLRAALDARTDRHVTWIITEHGRPRSQKAAAAWFSRACTEAGLPHLTAHGVRKGRAAMFKENGATLDQRLAWLGQETEAEGRHYSKSADLRRVIEAGTEIGNSLGPSGNFSA